MNERKQHFVFKQSKNHSFSKETATKKTGKTIENLTKQNQSIPGKNA